MYLFHRDWHQANPDPREQLPPPGSAGDPDWGISIGFGRAFLQMHHEMVGAAADEPREFMPHQSIQAWYAEKGYELPPPWDPLSPIPEDLGYQPDFDVYPDAIRAPLQQFFDQQGTTPVAWLTRKTNTPSYALPRWFTTEGVGDDETGEPLTGARRLSDFKNVNQLGACLVWPHNSWHGAIGGAMNSTWTAIADPIFYFGVHRSVDRVYLDYLALPPHAIAPLGATSTAPTVSAAERDRFVEQARETSAALQRSFAR